MHKIVVSLGCIVVFVSCLAAMAAEPFTWREVSFTARCDGTQQLYVIGLPAEFDPAKPHDMLIALHGHGSDRWQFVRDERVECKAVRDAAAAHDMIYISPDYRAKTSWMGPKAEADVVQIIEDLKREYRIGQVFICGGSMGGSSALTFAALHPELIAGVASINGTANHLEYANFQDAIAESFGGTKADKPLEYKNRSAEYWPERLTMPIGITAGGKDTLVPPGSVLRLAHVLKEMHRPVLVIYREEGEHSTDYDDSRRVLEFAITKRPPSTAPATAPH